MRLTASRKISTSIVFLPSTRCSSRTCFRRSRTSAALTTSSSASTAYTTALGHPAPPVKELARCYAVDSSHVGYRHARPIGLLNEADLLIDTEAAPALHARDDFDLLSAHSHTPRHTPRPSSYAGCPVEMGAAPSAQSDSQASAYHHCVLPCAYGAPHCTDRVNVWGGETCRSRQRAHDCEP